MSFERYEALREKYADELKVKHYAAEGSIFQVPVRSTPITPLDNFERFMKGEKILYHPNVQEFLNVVPRVLPDNKARGLISDEPVPVEELGGLDMFGVDWEYEAAVGGSMPRRGKVLVPDMEEWEKYIIIPKPQEWDWDHSKAINKTYIDEALPINVTILTGLFERLISFLTFQEAAVAIIDEDQKDAIHKFFAFACGVYDYIIGKYKECYNTKILTFHDDWGAQFAPLFSQDVIREMIAPYLKRVVDSAHRRGMYFEFHSCGRTETLVPIMIECGVDIYYPQTMNDIKKLHEKYGNQIKLGIPLTVSDDSVEEAVRAVDEFLETYAEHRNTLPRVDWNAAMPNPMMMEYLYCATREMFEEK